MQRRLSATESAPKPRNRAEATDVIRQLRRIVTPNGVERAQTVRIGGVDLWVTVRGDNNEIRCCLVLHGGPAEIWMPLNWWYARSWEEYFTVVEWDQRGAVSTYLLNNPEAVAPTMTREISLRTPKR